MSPAGVAPAELAWRKWLFWGTTPVAGLVIALGAWSVLSSRTSPDVPPPPVVEVPDEPLPVVKEPKPAEEEPERAAVRLDPRWLPGGTRLLVSLRTSNLAGREEFNLTVPLADPVWRAVVGKLLSAFGLRIEPIRRLSWASTDLAAWPDDGVVVIELEQGQDARGFRMIGESAGFELEGEPCRRLGKGDWPHPFAVLDELAIVTGREDLLRELADRTGPHLESVPIDRLFKAATPDADLIVLLDLAAARQAGWRLPNWLMDVWPAGREAWHVVWEMPQGLGLLFRRNETVVSEVAFSCEGETAAESVRAALDKLVPAAKTVMEAQVESLGEKLKAGRLTAAAADQYEVLLTRGRTALGAARWEVADETVWIRIDWGEEVAALVAAALDSRPTVRAEWLASARIADEANHRRLLSGLQGYRKAEGEFPAGAGGGALLAPETRLSWIATMLPYYGHRDWHRELDFGYSWNSPQNRPVTRRRLDFVVNPALGPSSTEAGFPVTHYVGVAGVGADAGTLEPGDPRAGVFGFRRTTRIEDIPDGAGNTIAILGVTERLGAWGAGGEPTVRALTKRPYVNGPDGFGSGQPDGMLAGMADGSVRFLSNRIDPALLEQLATVGGGEEVTVALLEPAHAPQPPPKPDDPSPEPDAPADKPPPAGADDASEPPAASEEPGMVVDIEPAEVDVEARLADSILDIGIPGIPLVDAIDLVSQVSTLRITLDLEAMAQLGVTIGDPVTVQATDATIGEILEAIVASRGLAYVVEDNHVLVTTPEKNRNALRAVTYTVSDLTGPQPASVAALAELVEKLVAPDSWRRAGGRGTIEPANGALKVVQTGAVHYEVLTFCEKLRSARGVPLRSRHDPRKFALATRLDQARMKLSQPITANFHEPAPLERIVSDLGALSGTKILIDWLALGSEGVSSQAKGSLSAENQPLSEALDELLRPLGLAYRVVDADVLEITTRKALAARLELEFYPLGDLVSEGATVSSLTGKIKDQVAGATWSDAGGPGVLDFDEPSRCLIVLQSQPVQFELESLLDRWRAEKAPKENKGHE